MQVSPSHSVNRGNKLLFCPKPFSIDRDAAGSTVPLGCTGGGMALQVGRAVAPGVGQMDTCSVDRHTDVPGRHSTARAVMATRWLFVLQHAAGIDKPTHLDFSRSPRCYLAMSQSHCSSPTCQIGDSLCIAGTRLGGQWGQLAGSLAARGQILPLRHSRDRELCFFI